MGDRALIQFVKNGPDGTIDERGAQVYLHWHGHAVLQLLRDAMPRLRKGDVSYATARFIGHCHEQIDGALSLGVFGDSDLPESQGSSGAFEVNLSTATVRHFGFNSKPEEIPPDVRDMGDGENGEHYYQLPADQFYQG